MYTGNLFECRRCPRLVEWRENVPVRRAFLGEAYWRKPVSGFGVESPEMLIVGLAPAAHGANRTGRMFTGDRSGDWLIRALYETGFADRPVSVSADDGLRLIDTYITSIVKCAPPANRPTVEERQNCRSWLDDELDSKPSVIVALGALAYDQTLRALRDRGMDLPVPKPRFAHGGMVSCDGLTVLASYHPSQQNTFTGRLTPEMLRSVFEQARSLMDTGGRSNRQVSQR